MIHKASPKLLAVVFSVLVLCFLTVFYLFAWTEPSVAPPGGNVAAPLNISSTAQTKTGRLTFTEFYDSNNTAYYVNPAGQTILAGKVGIGSTSVPASRLHVRGGSMVASGFDNVVANAFGTAGVEIGFLTGSSSGMIRSGLQADGVFAPIDIQATAVRIGPYIVGAPTVPDRPFLVVGTVDSRHTATFESLPGAAGPNTAMGIAIGHLLLSGVNYRSIQALNRNWSTGAVSYENLAINMMGGNVGIGTATPTARLDVNGGINFNGQKMCSVTSTAAGSPYRDTILVPAGWTAVTCQNWANSVEPGPHSWQLGCIFTNSFSWGAAGGGIPPSNCGW